MNHNKRPIKIETAPVTSRKIMPEKLPLHRAVLNRRTSGSELTPNDRLFHCWAAFLATIQVED
jgi:hypothetical protein